MKNTKKIENVNTAYQADSDKLWEKKMKTVPVAGAKRLARKKMKKRKVRVIVRVLPVDGGRDGYGTEWAAFNTFLKSVKHSKFYRNSKFYLGTAKQAKRFKSALAADKYVRKHIRTEGFAFSTVNVMV